MNPKGDAELFPNIRMDHVFGCAPYITFADTNEPRKTYDKRGGDRLGNFLKVMWDSSSERLFERRESYDSDLHLSQMVLRRRQTILHQDDTQKNERATISKLTIAQSVFLQIAEAFCRMATQHVHAKLPNLYPGSTNWRSANLRSARGLLSQTSHSFECGAVRFLFWWLFLHRRLRSGNEVQLASNCFAPLGGSSSKRYCSFLFEQFEKVSQPSLAEPFGSNLGRLRIDSRLSPLSPGRHRTVRRSLSWSRWP